MSRISTRSKRTRHTLGIVVMAAVVATTAAYAQAELFVTRSRDTLRLGNHPFYFLGTNAYYLLEQAARGDTQTVINLFRTASRLNMTVVRTWGFFDSSDSLNPAVIQYRPGVFNEHALQALDYVLLQARRHGIRLLIPFVNNWDDYGGMNQYVRWRASMGASADPKTVRYSDADMQQTVRGAPDRCYRYAITSQFGHDDFYSDPHIKFWFKLYISTLLHRINIFTGIAYKNDPFIFGWELANEPRSSDPSGRVVGAWAAEIASHVKSLDANHLVGTGEEGFDLTPAGYSLGSYNNQHWMFNGSAGISFRANCVIPPIDFGSCHLYPEVWNLPGSAGSTWIRDHIRLARAAGKPLIVGEFGVRRQRAAVYDSWLTTAVYDGAAGAMVWQVLEGPRTDREEFGFRCPGEELLCERLTEAGRQFIRKSVTGSLPLPQMVALRQNYPNPFNGVTTIAYSLPFEARVELAVFNTLGQYVTTIVAGWQSPGERKEVFDGTLFASGTYLYRLSIDEVLGSTRSVYRQTRKLVLLR